MRHRLTILVAAATAAVCAAAQPSPYIAKYLGDRQAAVTYTFDDGLLEHYTLVFPQLQRRGMKATFGIIGSKVGRDMKLTPCLSWANLRAMAADGQEIANHGWEHRNVTTLDSAALSREIGRNDSAIADSVGVVATTYFYPGNRKDTLSVAQCEAGRVGSRLRQVSLGAKRDSAWMRQWVDGLLERGDWGIAMTHGITIGYDAVGDTASLWKHFDYVQSLHDRLWIATLAEATAYAKERQSTTLTVENVANGMTVTPTTSLDSSVFRQPLTLVVPTTRPIKATQAGRTLATTQRDGHTIVDFCPHGGVILIEYTKPID